MRFDPLAAVEPLQGLNIHSEKGAQLQLACLSLQ